MRPRVRRDAARGLDDHRDHARVLAEGVKVVPALVFDPAAPRFVIERPIALAAALSAAEDHDAILLFRRAKSVEVADSRRRTPAIGRTLARRVLLLEWRRHLDLIVDIATRLYVTANLADVDDTASFSQPVRSEAVDCALSLNQGMFVQALPWRPESVCSFEGESKRSYA